MHEEIRKTFYRKRKDGSMGYAEISSYSYSDQDSFLQACYHFEEQGYFENREDAEDA